jgi:hypothetical protein
MAARPLYDPRLVLLQGTLQKVRYCAFTFGYTRTPFLFFLTSTLVT